MTPGNSIKGVGKTRQSRVVLLHESDNVYVCCQPVHRGEELVLDGVIVDVVDDIDTGHKMARRSLPVGAKIVKYGACIGLLTQAVRVGEHIHMHNLQSAYIPSHTRQGRNE